ncbi:hypothetical protein RJ639_013027 [Escallonia herrerae]|uniref:J domain-containing protein n=1 Tax=Escallonia herrerae TaxID=1293975 RepID=A0AA89AN05_9ASTE|nr:hypothetical protein RJ639_013027 [Escallonia herrerae]
MEGSQVSLICEFLVAMLIRILPDEKRSKLEDKTGDIAGAKRLAVKAWNLYRDLEGLPHMIAVLNVYSFAKNGGETDYYAILGVNQEVDEATLRKQYRKQLLVLHPDKNKSVGADGAFKLLSEAWDVLSNKTRRSAYDEKRIAQVFPQKFRPRSGGSSVSPASETSLKKPPTSSDATPRSNMAPKTGTTAESEPEFDICQVVTTSMFFPEYGADMYKHPPKKRGARRRKFFKIFVCSCCISHV